MEGSGLNRLARELAAALKERPLQEKRLLAPSLRVGYQWLDAVARAGRPTLNARVTTLYHLALELAAPAMQADGLTLLRGMREEVIAALVFSRLRKAARGRGYLSGLKPGPGLTRAVRAVLRDLRVAGLSPRDLDASGFEVNAKGREMANMLSLYEEELEGAGLTDYAGVLRLSAARLLSDPAALPPDTLVLAPEDLCEEWAGLERDLWEAVPQASRRVLPTDPLLAVPEEPDGGLTDLALLRWLPDPPSAPAPLKDDTVKIFRAVGEANEVREVLRRCVEEAIPLDTVELLHTDRDTYVPLVYEIASRLERENEEPLPVTFAEGIPARYSRPARALEGWLAWQREDYAQSTLVRLVQEGLVQTPRPAEEGFSDMRLGALLRALPIGSGRHRWLPVIDDELAHLSNRIECYEPGEDGEQEDGEPAERRLARLREREGALRSLRELVEALLGLVPEGAGQAGLLRGAAAFLRGPARCVDRLDAYARGALLEQIEEVLDCVGPGEVEGMDMRAWLEDLPRSARILGQGPRPGCLFVNHVAAGGHSGRAHTFIVGMDDARFPGAGLQDPLLLDAERASLSDRLPTAGARLARKEERFARLAARLRGRLTLCYSCRDLADDRDRFPAPSVLSAWRIVSGERDGDQAGLAAWLPPPASFAPDRPERCIDPTEWWLWRLCPDGTREDSRAVVAEHFPHLGRGFRALKARASDAFTAYDGYVPEAGAPCDPRAPGGPVLSARRLETLARCPMEYFFRYVLGIEPLEEYAVRPGVWLEPLERGDLLHDVFREFMSRLRAKDMLPQLRRDAALLEEITTQRIATWKKAKPPLNPDTFEREARELRLAARIFLTEEEAFCRDSRPAYLEASIGLPSGAAGSPLDSPDPVEITLPDGSSFKARGRIDRVDEAVLEGDLRAFDVWDYKTGSDWGFDRNDPLCGGRRLQHVLYLELVQARLDELHPGSAVRGCGYFFPGERAHGERYYWTAAQLERGPECLSLLCRLLAGGCFPFTDTPADVGLSDFRPAFGDVEAAAADAARKLANPRNLALLPFAALRGVEAG